MANYTREMIVVAVVFENLIKQHHMAIDTVEEQLIIEAFRRSSNELQGASLMDLGDYLVSMNEGQLKGVANNVKGIYHELKYVHDFNEVNKDLRAELYGNTNHPGSDVIIRDVESGTVLETIQLKATDSASYATENLDKYPDVPIYGTTEISTSNAEILSTGFSNKDLKEEVADQTSQLENASTSNQVLDGLETSALISGSMHALDIMQGKAKADEATKKAIGDIAIGTGTSALVAILFS